MPIYRTYSELRTAQGCTLAHHLRYEKKLRTKDSDFHFFRVGGAVHEFIDQMYKYHFKQDEIIRKVREHLKPEHEFAMQLDPNFTPEVAKIEMATVEGLLRLYYRECYLKENIQMVETEAEFQLDFHEFILTGKIDGRLKNETGEHHYIHEIKTRANGWWGPRQVADLPLDEQIKIYVFAANNVWRDSITRGALYTVLIKPGIRQRVKDTVQDYCDRIIEEYTDMDGKDPGYSAAKYLSRHYVYHSTLTMQEVYNKVIQMNRAIVNRVEPFPWSGDHCGICDFKDYCKTVDGASRSLILANNFVMGQSKHTELAFAI
ncbi:MAG: PD-(D/E)XK nuclease family protein [Candidatus Neomarinimicrobiota bacterium]